MNFNETLKHIESIEFAVQANLASGFKSFFRIVCDQEPVQELVKKLSKSLRQRHLVLTRIKKLARKQIDFDYANPWDTALATYLHVLSLVDLDLAEEGAATLSEVPNCWWATKLAQHLSRMPRIKATGSSASISRYELQPISKPPTFGRPVKTQIAEERYQIGASFKQQNRRTPTHTAEVRTDFVTVYTSPQRTSVKASSLSSKEIFTIA